MTDLTQLNKLEQYLLANEIKYERIDQETKYDELGMIELLERHQIYVPDKENSQWDVICHEGSYGHEEGLLEVMGTIVDPFCGDTVEGWLSAADVIERIEGEKNEDTD